MLKSGLSKNDSVAIKGIAIILMLLHHLYVEPGRFEMYDVSFAPFTEGSVIIISRLAKMCVCMFAFITGYGLLKSISRVQLDKNNVTKWSISRLIKMLSGFWFVYVVSFIVTFILNRLPVTQYFQGRISEGLVYILIDFLGLANFFGTPTLIGTWWYMSAAIVFVLIIPIAYMAAKKVGYLPIITIVYALARLIGKGYPGTVNIYSFIPSVLFGMMFADHNLFEKISEKSPKNKVLSYILHFIVFGGIVASIVYIPCLRDDLNARTKVWEITYGVLPVFAICFARYCFIRIPVIKQILVFLGKYSMTIFLTHSFIRYTYLNEFVYSFKNSTLIYLVLLGLSLPLAIIIDSLRKLCRYDKLINKITSKITVKNNK